MDRCAHVEQRLSPRRRRFEFVECLWRAGDIFHTVWVLESSESGMAFAWRGSDPPRPDTILELRRSGAPVGAGTIDAVVRRTSIAHDDLTVIAVEFLGFRPFQGEPHAQLSTYEEPKQEWTSSDPLTLAA